MDDFGHFTGTTHKRRCAGRKAAPSPVVGCGVGVQRRVVGWARVTGVGGEKKEMGWNRGCVRVLVRLTYLQTENKKKIPRIVTDPSQSVTEVFNLWRIVMDPSQTMTTCRIVTEFPSQFSKHPSQFSLLSRALDHPSQIRLVRHNIRHKLWWT